MSKTYKDYKAEAEKYLEQEERRLKALEITVCTEIETHIVMTLAEYPHTREIDIFPHSLPTYDEDLDWDAICERLTSQDVEVTYDSYIAVRFKDES